MKHLVRSVAFIVSGIVAAGCSDRAGVQPDTSQKSLENESPVATYNCTGDVAARTVSCTQAGINSSGLKLAVIVGGQNGNVKITTGPATYNSSNSQFTFATTLQNLMSQAMGTTNGTSATAGGIRVFFSSGPTLTSGSGVASVIADGFGTFTGPAQPYYDYTGSVGDGILSPGETSSAKTWTLVVPNNATFTFILLLYTDVQYPPASQTIFKRIVAMGGANAAGFASAGIVDSAQVNAYPTQIAVRAGAVFRVPLVAKPGCPTPVTSFGTPPNPIGSCTVEVPEPLAATGKNVAVPGAPMTGVLNFPTTTQASFWNSLLHFGAHTQVELMQNAAPTFVILGGGDEDVLAAALAGRLGTTSISVDSLLTRESVFTAAYTSVANSIAAQPTLQGAVLVGILDPLTYDPILQPGAYFFLSRDVTGKFGGMPVNNNCSPVTPFGTPNPLSTNLVSFALFDDVTITEINCDPAVHSGDYVIDPAEAALIHNRVAAFNATIQSIATSHNWAYVNPNTVFASSLTTVVNGRYPLIRKCQLLPTATTAAQFQTAVLTSCPFTGVTAASPIGGSMFSQDGTTLSKQGQTFLADFVAAAINAKYGTSIPLSP